MMSLVKIVVVATIMVFVILVDRLIKILMKMTRVAVMIIYHEEYAGSSCFGCYAFRVESVQGSWVSFEWLCGGW